MKILSKKRLMKKAGFFKRIPPKRDGKPTSRLPNPLEQVYREIAILKKLDHPNVVRLVEVLDDPDEDNLYVVFELLERGEVVSIPTDTPLSQEQAWQYFRDIVLGIEYRKCLSYCTSCKQATYHTATATPIFTHTHTLTNEYLFFYAKSTTQSFFSFIPLMTHLCYSKIADFGVSNEFTGGDAFFTSTSGTPAFQAPETLKDFLIFQALDIWAMGVTLHCFVYGQCPFHDEYILLLHKKILRDPVIFPDEPEIEDDLKGIILRMLDKNPETRITLPEIKIHPWVTKDGTEPLPSEEENCVLITVTEEEVENVVKHVPRLETLEDVRRFNYWRNS
ncbi:calcium/calmodulin-dependent protein kinase kinase 1-like [Octopus bimaculoides]|uniref:calcium/calmodulin-dependent protein kinase kinase 1-like n=1 Tax=Octopus bimaculoides TaxID=37653 RepID=UPI0022E5134E|nr:calcium/calmodulin-dependent protein kinase kinase 1-like [Octopus bimaculoides]